MQPMVLEELLTTMEPCLPAMSTTSTKRLCQGLILGILTLGCAGSLSGGAPALAGTYAITSNWDLENARRILKEAIPKDGMEINMTCQTMNLAKGNDLSRCGAHWRMP